MALCSISETEGPRRAYTCSGRASQILFLCVIVLAGWAAHAQEGGTVSGVVVSSYNGAPLRDAIITVRGTTLSAQTDASGRYELKNVPAGEQVLRISKGGYTSKPVTDVQVIQGQTTTVNGNLQPEFITLDEVESTATEINIQTQDLIKERSEKSTLTESIGADLIKTLSIDDAGGALAKTTGASVVDGKFAVIRGLADRYTSTTLNGADIPSADPDRRAVQLDLFPSQFIRRIDVSKTFSPDIGGGFAGGAINIVTRDFPDDFTFSVGAGVSYNTQASLKDDYLITDHGSRDWLAMDDGTRELPKAASSVPATGTQQPLPINDNTFNSKQWAPIEGDSFLNSSFSITVGDTERLFNRRLGYLFGINYKHDFNIYHDGTVARYQPRFGDVFAKNDVKAVIEYNWGALVSLTYELHPNHRIGFNFLYTKAAEDEARELVGQDETLSTVPGQSFAIQDIMHWTERNLTYYQVKGDHDFPEVNNIKFDWVGSLSTTTQEEPDYRIFQTFVEQNDPNDPNDDIFGADGASAPSRPTRFWRDIEENNRYVGANLLFPLPSYNSRDNALKFGTALSKSERDFNGRAYDIRIAGNSSFHEEGDPNDLDSLHTYHNFAGGSVVYKGEQTITAGYAMADWAVLEWLRLVGGGRYEITEISLTGRNLTLNAPLPPGTIEQNDLLPALSGTIYIRENLLLRAAWSETVIRPIYREIAPAAIYDVAQNRQYIGNPDLILSQSRNYDVRLEWFPQPGALLALSLFKKKITAPIEQSAEDRDSNIVTFENFEKADVRGIEFEARQDLGRLWKPLEHFTVGFNGAYIESEVPITPNQLILRSGFGETGKTRPLYDQPEYVINGDLTWDYPDWGLSMTVAGGVVGRRLVLVGLGRPDEYEEPAAQLDVFVTKRFGKHFRAKFSAKNLINPVYEVTQDWPGFGTRVTESYQKGLTFGLSVAYDF